MHGLQPCKYSTSPQFKSFETSLSNALEDKASSFGNNNTSRPSEDETVHFPKFRPWKIKQVKRSEAISFASVQWTRSLRWSSQVSYKLGLLLREKHVNGNPRQIDHDLCEWNHVISHKSRWTSGDF